jgi:hypothetical protein
MSRSSFRFISPYSLKQKIPDFFNKLLLTIFPKIDVSVETEGYGALRFYTNGSGIDRQVGAAAVCLQAEMHRQAYLGTEKECTLMVTPLSSPTTREP